MHPNDIAREVFKLFAERKLLPTPANYLDCYSEITEVPNIAGFPESRLRKIALGLKPRTSAHQALLDTLDAAIGHRSWQEVEDALIAYTEAVCQTEPDEDSTGPLPDHDAASGESLSESIRDLLFQVAQLIENIQRAFEQDDDRFNQNASALLGTLRSPDVEVQDVEGQMASFSTSLSFVAEEQAEIRQSLLKLLHLIIENIGKLTLSDSWFDGQIEALLQATMPPINLRRLDDVEQRIRMVMDRQAATKARALEAQEEMRHMLSSFIEQLGEMNESSVAYQERIETRAHQVGQVKTLEELAPVLKDIIDATHEMANTTANSRNQLKIMQEKVLAAEAEVAKLHLELDSASAMARHDPLTNVLNRMGLDEALVREIAAARRSGTTLCIALLDVDNFKQINDRLGHETGDRALVHLVNVIREGLRPLDTLARYGGEEFIILMPDTNLDDAETVMTRLQRELTRNFFLAGNEKVLITFSAGVARLAPAEESAEAIKRADKAMYLAKRAGKNRVFSN